MFWYEALGFIVLGMFIEYGVCFVELLFPRGPQGH